MIRKDWNVCDHIMKAAAILEKKLKIFIFIFRNFDSSFF